MSHLARQFIFYGRYYTLDEMTSAVEAVTSDDVQRVANDLFRDEGLAATVVGPAKKSPLSEGLTVG